jgi:6-phosphofructokinase 1
MVAANYGALAADLLLAKQSGRMVALKNGCYTHVSMTETRAGARKVDIEALYDAVDYRPRMRAVEGMPMFLR